MKIVAMIPARLTSERVKMKNLRLLNGKPLISYAIENCINSGVFDEIYINSDALILREIAEAYGVKFYERNPELAKSEVTNDQFAFDFLKNIKCDFLFQVLPTSPLLTPEDIRRFVSYMISNNFDTVLSVKEERIEALFRNEPINFMPKMIMPKSQDLEPVKLFCNAIMGWRAVNFINNYETFGCAVYGGEGKVGYFTLSGLATIDIDNEGDFQLAELAMEQRLRKIAPTYFSTNQSIEKDVFSILEKDGVKIIDLHDCNKQRVNLEEIKREFSHLPSWSKRLINSESNSVTLICQAPGEGNRPHYHADWNEWWLILEGEWQWEIDEEKIIVREGDMVFIEKNRVHCITAIGNKPAIRMAVSRDNISHIYPQRKGEGVE